MPSPRDDETAKLRADAAKKLILEYQNGDLQAFNRLIGEFKYWQYIFKALRAKGVPAADAEDYTQQICMRLTKGLKKFRFACPFESYLNTIVKNQMVNYYRRGLRLENGKKVKRRFMSLDDLIATDEDEATLMALPNAGMPLPDDDLLFQELRRVIGTCLELFKNKTIKLVTSLWLYGIKQRQIAALLQLPLGNVGVNLHRGQQRLRHCVRKNYV
jgi:RNA polymerase sigma factor (sigma-70 family)